MPLTVGVKNKNCIKQLHFFLSKIKWPQISEEKKRKHAWHLNKNGSKGLVHMYLDNLSLVCTGEKARSTS